MGPTQHPEPAEVVGLEGVLAAHWECGTYAGNATFWECICGHPLGESSDDIAGRHVAHVAEQVRAWLGVRLASEAVVEVAARAVRDTVHITPLGPNSRAVHESGGSVHLRPDEANTAAHAALAAALGALA